MELINATKMAAGYTMATQPDGRDQLVVVVKGTFTLPRKGEPPQLADKQVALTETDVFTGEPGFSAPLYEIDFAPRKPRCDVLLNGSAYAPRGKPVTRVTVSLRVGSWKKSFDVVGNRRWKAGNLYTSITEAEPFTVMPISYNNAFGGVDRSREDPTKHRYFLENHVGVGYHAYLDAKSLDGTPLPNTEETGVPVMDPDGKYRPMAFGPLGRAWKQRARYAGTYDQNWIDNVFPFLPADFRDEYYQAAPFDQWLDYLTGGEEVELTNLTPLGKAEFVLPGKTIPVEFFFKNGDRKKLKCVTDTLVFEPDLGHFTMNWRCALPLPKSIHDILRTVAGTKPHGWYRDEGLRPRRTGKQRVKSLADLTQGNRP
jgi:hypothetical protein